MKKAILALFVVFAAYSAFKNADAVRSIDFRGENYALSEQSRRAGSDVYMYSPGGENFLRAGKYIQVAHLPKVDMAPEEYRRQYMEAMKRTNSFKKLTEHSFFYIEANTLVHSSLVQDEDRFKLYGYAEIRSAEELTGQGTRFGKKAIARSTQ
jgi:hypothetical protein